MLFAFYSLIVVLYLQTFGPRRYYIATTSVDSSAGPRRYYNATTSVDSRAGPRRYYNVIILHEPNVASGTAGINTFCVKVV